MAKIVIINGYPESGKDTFINYCSQYAKVKNISTVDRVKEALKILGWDGKSKTPEVRKALSDMKDISTKLFNGPFNYVTLEAKVAHNTEIVFIHCREPEEIDKLKNALGAATLLIDRVKSDRQITNHADQKVYNYSYDYIVDNNDTLDMLKLHAKLFVKRLKNC